MSPFIAVVATIVLGALAAPEPPADIRAVVVDAVYARALGDFDQVVADLGLSGAAPLHGLEPARLEDKGLSGSDPAKRARRSATSKSTSRP